MQFISVDDEELVQATIVHAIQAAEPESTVTGFLNPTIALEAVSSGVVKPDIAFLDIEMTGMTGIELAKKLKDISPKTAIIFVTGYSKYALDAYSVHARGYLLKPVTVEQVRAEIDALQDPVIQEKPLPSTKVHRLKAVCFGTFDVYVDGKELTFPRSKCKELLAYLIHKRGCSITVRDIAAVLFEDKEYTTSLLSHVRTIISTMIKTLEEAGVSDIVEKRFNSVAIIPDKIDCDLYRFLNGEVDAVNSYFGEYLTEYEWAKFTVGYLDKQIEVKA